MAERIFMKETKIKFYECENEPDKRKTYNVDGTKVTVNLFFAKDGKTVEQAMEDYIVKQAAKTAVNC
jgi:hypothetical protein